MNNNTPPITTQLMILNNTALLKAILDHWNKHTGDFLIDRPLTITDPDFLSLTDIQINLMRTLHSIQISHLAKRRIQTNVSS
jgi:hypothetical protein